MLHKESINKIENLIQEATKIKLKLLEAENDSNTVISTEQGKELIRELRDVKLRQLLGDS